MFTAIQTKFQRHYKILFFVLLVVVIVAFVFTIGAAPGIGREPGGANRQEFLGYNLASERDQLRLIRAGELSYRIEHGEAREFRPGQLENYAVERLIYLGLAEQMRIPPPTDEDLMQYILGRQAFQDDRGQFDRRRFARFTDEIEADPQRSEGDVRRILEEDYRIEKVRDLVSGPGFVLPAEVRRELERNQTMWTLEVASYDLGEFTPELEITDEALEEFFQENPRRYERPAQTVFSYVEFHPDQFLDRVEEPTDEEITEYFERNRERFVEPAAEEEEDNGDEQGEETDEPVRETTVDDVREEVVEAIQQERARRLANHAASDFTYALFDQGIQPDSERFPELIDAFNGILHDAPPASPDRFPQELGFPFEVQQQVFRLSDSRFFTDPQRVNDHFIVLVYRESIPSYTPPLDEIRDRVERDFEAQEERRLLSERGEEIRQRLQEKMDAGASLAEAAEEEGLQVIDLEPFSRIAPPENLPPPVLQRLDEFRKDRVSSMIQAQNYGFFAVLKEREVPEIDAGGGEFQRTADTRRMFATMATPQGVVQEFYEREIAQSARN